MSSVLVRQVMAGPMQNCLYIVADTESKQALLVDPAFEPVELLGIAEAEGFEVVGVIATHCHPDHVGGSLMGFKIPGLAELREARELPIWIHETEAQRVMEQTGTPESQIRRHQEGSTIELGGLGIEVLHTPGHSPGSCCFRAGEHLITADTLFVQGCGRTDLPGSDPEAMFHSLQRLAGLDPGLTIYPGHNYGPSPTSTIGDEVASNPYLRPNSLEQWRAMMG